MIYEAFFASKVLDITTKIRIDEQDITILSEALDHISEIKKGKKLVSFEKTDDYSISSIAAYSRAIDIIPLLEKKLGELDDKPELCIEKFLSNIETEIKKVLDNYTVEENDLAYTKAFFREIRKKVLTESNNTFMTTRKVTPWLEKPIY